MQGNSSGFYSVDSLRGVAILLVDEEDRSRRLIKEILEYCGALVINVPSPDEALGVIRQLKLDVIVTALSLPDDGALILIRTIRSLKPEEGGVTPAIAVSATDVSPPTLRTRGFQGWITLPVDPWELCRMISNFVLTTSRS